MTTSWEIKMVSVMVLLACFLLKCSIAQSDVHVDVQGSENQDPPFLLVTAWRSIIRLQINGSEPKEIVKESNGGIIAVDYHYRKSMLFYLVTDFTPGLYSVPLFAESKESAMSQRNTLAERDMQHPIGLAVDWINDKVFWTDRDRHTIEEYDLGTQQRRMLVQLEVTALPQGLSIYPYTHHGWLYLMSKSTSNIDRTSELIRITSDGNQQTTVRSGLCSSTTTLDHLSSRLYWIDECGYKIEESLLDGLSPHTVVGGISNGNGIDFSRGLAQYHKTCFATQKNHVYNYSFQAQGEANNLLYSVSESMTLGGLQVVHSSQQPSVDQLSAIGLCSPSCVNGLCIFPGVCTCFPGWKGPTCLEGGPTTLPRSHTPSSSIIEAIIPTISSTIEPTSTSYISADVTSTSILTSSFTSQSQSTIMHMEAPKPIRTTVTPEKTQLFTTSDSADMIRSTTTTQMETTIHTHPLTTGTPEKTQLFTTSDSADMIRSTTTTQMETTIHTHPLTTGTPETQLFTTSDSVDMIISTATTQTETTIHTHPLTSVGPRTTPSAENPTDGLTTEQEIPSSMVLIAIVVCIVVILLIFVATVSYIFLIYYKYKQRRKGSYNVYRSRLHTDSNTSSTRNSFRSIIEYYPRVNTRDGCHNQATITGSESVDSFERMSIDEPLVEQVRAEVIEAQLDSSATAIIQDAPLAPAATGASNSRRMNSGFSTLYATEQKEIYFSL